MHFCSVSLCGFGSALYTRGESSYIESQQTTPNSMMRARSAEQKRETGDVLTWISDMASAGVGRREDDLVDKFDWIVTRLEALSLEFSKG